MCCDAGHGGRLTEAWSQSPTPCSHPDPHTHPLLAPTHGLCPLPHPPLPHLHAHPHSDPRLPPPCKRRALAAKERALTELQQEQMRLLAQLETLTLTAGSASAAKSTGNPVGNTSWRPPLHPPDLVRRTREEPTATLSMWPPATTGNDEAGAHSDRSDASTVSGGEWPDELHIH